jgi:hypothetical protein
MTELPLCPFDFSGLQIDRGQGTHLDRKRMSDVKVGVPSGECQPSLGAVQFLFEVDFENSMRRIGAANPAITNPKTPTSQSLLT